MFEINLSKEKIGELEYHVNYSQELSFCMSNGMVETSELKIKAQIFNKENEKELLYNELEINLFKKKEENE